jgi:3-(3-hydroxy-phenyl)propionate hydroxylase
MRNVDVIIVGLGPTGAALAGLLGQAGVRVAVFDKLPDLYPLPRAIGLDQEAMRIVQQLALSERMAEHVAPYRPSEYRGMDGQLIKRLDTLPEPHLLGWAPNYVFDQPSFERALRARLAELPSVEVFVSAQVEATGQDTAGAWADVKLSEDTSATRFSASYLVACDGGSSPIRTRMGIQLEDLEFDEPWLVVDAIVSDEKLAQLPQTQVQYCEAARPSTFVVGPGKHRRWEIMLLEGDSLSPEFPEAELWPLLSRWIKPGDAKLWRAAAYRFHGLVATEWRRDRILLAGDSAHMTPPFMAQGMVGGMRDALNLAWKLRRVLKGESPATLLDSYMEERRPHMRQTILTAMSLGRIICERDAARAVERDQRLLAAHGGEVKTEYRQNMIPNLEHGVIASGAALSGVLFPQPTVLAAGFLGRLDDLTGARVRVAVQGPLSAQEKEAYLQALASVDGVLVQLGEAGAASGPALEVSEERPLLAPWLDAAQQSVVVVRPDHYIFGAAAEHGEGLHLLEDLKAALA